MWGEAEAELLFCCLFCCFLRAMFLLFHLSGNNGNSWVTLYFCVCCCLRAMFLVSYFSVNNGNSWVTFYSCICFLRAAFLLFHFSVNNSKSWVTYSGKRKLIRNSSTFSRPSSTVCTEVPSSLQPQLSLSCEFRFYLCFDVNGYPWSGYCPSAWVPSCKMGQTVMWLQGEVLKSNLFIVGTHWRRQKWYFS